MVADKPQGHQDIEQIGLRDMLALLIEDAKVVVIFEENILVKELLGVGEAELDDDLLQLGNLEVHIRLGPPKNVRVQNISQLR